MYLSNEGVRRNPENLPGVTIRKVFYRGVRAVRLDCHPLLLTMIANVHRYRGALPGSRADLYSEICQVMLWRRQDAKNLAQPIGGDKKEAILRGLAHTMMERRVSDLPCGGWHAALPGMAQRAKCRGSQEWEPTCSAVPRPSAT